MFDRIIGMRLVERGIISKEKLRGLYRTMDESNARLGVIAVSERLITVAQAEEVNAMQATEDRVFGDMAVEQGYLSPRQVDRLLELQQNRFLVFSQALVDGGYMTMEELDAEIRNYQTENGFTETDMMKLKSCDVEEIVSVLLDTSDHMLERLCTLAVKDIFRLADHHISINAPWTTSNIKGEAAGFQRLRGDVRAFIAITGRYEDIRSLAVSYANEELIETREDALDAVCELINCINGMFATELSRENVNVEIEPPSFRTSFSDISASKLVVVPVVLSGGGEVRFVVAMGEDIVTV